MTISRTRRIRSNGKIAVLSLFGTMEGRIVATMIALIVIVITVYTCAFAHAPRCATVSRLLTACHDSTTTSNTSDGTNRLDSNTGCVGDRVRACPRLMGARSMLRPIVSSLNLSAAMGRLTTDIATSGPSNAVLISVSIGGPSPGRTSDVTGSITRGLEGRIASAVCDSRNSGVVSPIGLAIIRRTCTPTSPDSPGIGLGLTTNLTINIVLNVIITFVGSLLSAHIHHSSSIATIVSTPMLKSLDHGRTCTNASPIVVSHPTSHRTRRVQHLHAGIVFILPSRPLSGMVIIASANPSRNGAALDIGLTATFTRGNDGMLLVSTSIHGPSIDGTLNVRNTINLARLVAGHMSSRSTVRHC